MVSRNKRSAQGFVWGIFALFLVCALSLSAQAAPYAALVMDVRTGTVLHSRNADTQLHPASLTKMMTLYIAFEAVESGEISLDEKIKISRNAAGEPPSKLGLRSGQYIKFRYLIRAAALKSANDAATAIGEAISGSEAAFAVRMNRTAKALGMPRTRFKNAHGLTQSGHLSTARDMSILGRALFHHYPEYYNLFSRRSTSTDMGTVRNTNRRLLANYRGADGIKTGYTHAAGFNLVSSAQRGNERIIATVFGGKSSQRRNKRVAELLDMGFERAPSRVELTPPPKPIYPSGPSAVQINRVRAVKTSPFPVLRPQTLSPFSPEARTQTAGELASLVRPSKKITPPKAEGSADPDYELSKTEGSPQNNALLAYVPRPRPSAIAVKLPTQQKGAAQEIVKSDRNTPRDWGITLGAYPTSYAAETALLQSALLELEVLGDAERKVKASSQGYKANFFNLTKAGAERACSRLHGRGQHCAFIKK